MVPVRAVDLSIGPFCTEFWCERFCDDGVFEIGSILGARDINTKICTKVAPIRAVDISIGPFCTEFRCERFCDDDIFWDRGQLLGSETEIQKWSRK